MAFKLFKKKTAKELSIELEGIRKELKGTPYWENPKYKKVKTEIQKASKRERDRAVKEHYKKRSK